MSAKVTLSPAILSIDGGSSTIKYGVISYSGKVLYSAKFADTPLNLHAFVKNSYRTSLLKILEIVLNKYSINYIILGVSGIDSITENKFVESCLKNFFAKEDMNIPFFVLGDIYLSLNLVSSIPRICLIAGTGSNCIGESKAGSFNKSGGVGMYLSDEGSGYFIGDLALRAVIKDLDRRGQKTILTKLILNKLNVSTVFELKNFINKSTYIKSAIASFTPQVVLASKMGDSVSKKILSRAVAELFSHIKAVYMQSPSYSKNTVNIILTGSIIKIPYIKNTLISNLNKLGKNIKIIIPTQPSYYGGFNLLKSKGLFYQ